MSALPFVVESIAEGDRLSTEIYSVLERPFGEVATAFTQLDHWCEFMPLNLNVKSCTYQRSHEGGLLSLYVGRKFYQPPEDAHILGYRYRVDEQSDSSFKVSLAARKGPLGTSDYRLAVDAVAMEQSTLLRISVAYKPSWMSQLATSTYLATLGRHKVGFSVESVNSLGQPVFSRGEKGVIERNAMRYYLAMKVYVETESLPVEERFDARINRWFEMTEIYAKQLHELERDEYLDAKQREWRNQQMLQAQLFSEAET